MRLPRVQVHVGNSAAPMHDVHHVGGRDDAHGSTLVIHNPNTFDFMLPQQIDNVADGAVLASDNWCRLATLGEPDVIGAVIKND